MSRRLSKTAARAKVELRAILAAQQDGLCFYCRVPMVPPAPRGEQHENTAMMLEYDDAAGNVAACRYCWHSRRLKARMAGSAW